MISTTTQSAREPRVVYIEGPKWMGCWTEVAHHAIEALGHEVLVHYHNKRHFIDKLLGADKRTSRSNERLLDAMHRREFDVLLSIQGRVNTDTLEELRAINPKLVVLYWIGDARPLDAFHLSLRPDLVDRYLLSTRGLFDAMCERSTERAVYFPFAISEALHQIESLSAIERKRYGCKTAFVGTYYPEREELISSLNRQLPEPVSVWGRSWRNSNEISSRGRLTMGQTLKVHRAADISLNLHHRDTANGFNMKLFEIVAAGGFPLTDWQQALEYSEFGAHMPSFRDAGEAKMKIEYYLAHPEEREQTRLQLLQTMLRYDTYEIRFKELFDNLGLSFR